MERWTGRVAVVTGASAGIGAAIAGELVKKGLKVVGLARRVERVEALEKSLKSEKGKLYAIKCDVTNDLEVTETFKWIKRNLGGVDILINNAGVGSFNSIRDGPVENWRKIFDLNVLALSVCTKEALQSMKEKGVDDGHIIHISSIAGHTIPLFPGIEMYSASKHAVTALTEGLRRELVKQKSKIRVTVITSTMERWSGRVAVVTGASAGIGAAIAEELVKKGLKVVGLARRVERVEDLANSIKSATGKLYPLKCDVSKESEVTEAFKWIKTTLGGVDILINSAGVGSQSSLTDGPVEKWRKIFDLNVLALSVCTKEALQSMKEKGVDDGHIIHINRFVRKIKTGARTYHKTRWFTLLRKDKVKIFPTKSNENQNSTSVLSVQSSVLPQ
ncbi:Dehydrogenase/reductase SDR family member 11 [Cryptotermes secundus]|uniref:Dehydrogenase/reductase SDR family member 11 n=1 Tax=Cryptotermes secundus TaxID=105785 RepID=A0A2J7PJT6_9NEOP|nr:Dehydrogenase/reductase SDR family member 11 [Cryptotermes secundus]